MLLWRISNFLGLDGVGGELSSGRWHTAAEGKRVVYFAEHPAVALLENLANLRGDAHFFLNHFQLLKVSTPEESEVTELTPEQLVSVDSKQLASTQTVGDAWLASGSSLFLRVPSIPSPESWNYLCNPLHPDANLLQIDWGRRITYDKRLFHLDSR